jgi:hypothetical protein
MNALKSAWEWTRTAGKRKLAGTVCALPYLLSWFDVTLPEPWMTWVAKAAALVVVLGWVDAGVAAKFKK